MHCSVTLTFAGGSLDSNGLSQTGLERNIVISWEPGNLGTWEYRGIVKKNHNLIRSKRKKKMFTNILLLSTFYEMITRVTTGKMVGWPRTIVMMEYTEEFSQLFRGRISTGIPCTISNAANEVRVSLDPMLAEWCIDLEDLMRWVREQWEKTGVMCLTDRGTGRKHNDFTTLTFYLRCMEFMDVMHVKGNGSIDLDYYKGNDKTALFIAYAYALYCAHACEGPVGLGMYHAYDEVYNFNHPIYDLPTDEDLIEVAELFPLEE